MADPTLNDNARLSRFELLVDGEVAGFAAYTLSGDVLRMTHTEIDPAHEGKGYGSQLARLALDRVREEGRKVIPACGFIAGFIEKHAEYRELVQG